MRTAAARFLRHLERERNASANTVRAYGEDLGQFTEYLQRELGKEPRPEDVDHLLVRGFLAELHRRGLRKSSAAGKLAGLRSFFRYLCREGRLETSPARALATPRQEQRIPSVLDEAQPHSAGRHQEFNAIKLREIGAAFVVFDNEMSGELLAKHIREMFGSDSIRKEMQRASRGLGRPEACSRIGYSAQPYKKSSCRRTAGKKVIRYV